MMVKLLYDEATQKRLDFWERALTEYRYYLLGIHTKDLDKDDPVMITRSNEVFNRIHGDPSYRKILDTVTKIREAAIPIGYMMFGDDPEQPVITKMETDNDSK